MCLKPLFPLVLLLISATYGNCQQPGADAAADPPNVLFRDAEALLGANGNSLRQRTGRRGNRNRTRQAAGPVPYRNAGRHPTPQTLEPAEQGTVCQIIPECDFSFATR